MKERERERKVGSKENEKEQEIVPLRLFLSNLVSDEDFLRTCYMISFWGNGPSSDVKLMLGISFSIADITSDARPMSLLVIIGCEPPPCFCV